MRTGEKAITNTAMLVLTSAGVSLFALAPSVAAGMYLIDHRLPLQSPFMIICAILILAVSDFLAVLLLETYRSKLSPFTLPALLAALTVIFLFIIAETINRFFHKAGYEYLTPVVVACLGFLYITAFAEKNISLKCYISLNSIAVMMLWALGAAGRLMMPF